MPDRATILVSITMIGGHSRNGKIKELRQRRPAALARKTLDEPVQRWSSQILEGPTKGASGDCNAWPKSRIALAGDVN